MKKHEEYIKDQKQFITHFMQKNSLQFAKEKSKEKRDNIKKMVMKQII